MIKSKNKETTKEETLKGEEVPTSVDSFLRKPKIVKPTKIREETPIKTGSMGIQQIRPLGVERSTKGNIDLNIDKIILK